MSASMLKRLRRRLRYWLIKLALYLFGWLPARFAGNVGERLGALAYHLARGERRKALASVHRAFPELDALQQHALVRRNFVHLGRAAGELVAIRDIDAHAADWIDWPAADRAVLDAALAHRKGIVFVTAHLGNWELLARTVGRSGYSAYAVSREASDGWMSSLIERFRNGGDVKVIWRGAPSAARQMVRALRENGVLGILIDQDTRVQSVWVPFFRHPAKTPRAAADLAIRTGAPVVVGFAARDRDGKYRIAMREIPVPQGSNAVTELTAGLTSAIEAGIRSYPEQWVWMHERWKSQSPPRDQ